MKPLTTNQQLMIGAVITVIILFAALLYEHHVLQGAVDVIQEQERVIELLKSQKTETIIKRDTVYKTETVYVKPPQPKEKVVYDTVYIPSDQPLFLVSKSFQDELLQGNLTINYQADVMGYQRNGEDNLPSITNMAVKVRYPETQTATETTTTQTIVQPQRKRLKPIILPAIGVGYDPIHNTIAPTVGISVGLAKGT